MVPCGNTPFLKSIDYDIINSGCGFAPKAGFYSISFIEILATPTACRGVHDVELHRSKAGVSNRQIRLALSSVACTISMSDPL